MTATLATTDDDTAVLRRLIDEAAIHDLVAAFADAAIHQLDDVAPLWTADSVFEDQANRIRFEGPEHIAHGLGELRRQWTSFVHDEHSAQVRVDGDAATGNTRCVQLTRSVASGALLTFATFNDEYARADGRWRFAARRYRLVEQVRTNGVAISRPNVPTRDLPAERSPFAWQGFVSSP